VVAIMARWMLSSTFGVINWVMLNVGIFESPVSFLASPQLAMPTAIAVNVYKWFAFVGVMYLAVLQGIPNDLYEAARMDGSNKLQEFRYITLPALLPTVGVMSLLMTFWNFNTFGLVWLLTAGGPGTTTTTLPILVYRRAFQRYRLSEAAALSVVMFLFLFVYTVIYQRIRDRADSEQKSYGAAK
jgi:multiple sugar transport system permease protein